MNSFHGFNACVNYSVARTPPSISKEDEEEEEHSNALSNTGYLRSRDDDINKEVIESEVPHPGILAGESLLPRKLSGEIYMMQ